ncbi:hypothetical protein LT679_02230 [Mucilaginibacter roseus]|uniref:Uncharacterized protein n=1 Tax=Mucilaginibacter roseus TaxID=1528868 RepID=A0ABS8TZI0_9SPHI|nr:hypothetical protein [Mucilaginibacter roseus]MCD8739407.1 hypothetical protein [Mucilaginibacter roseus]
MSRSKVKTLSLIAYLCIVLKGEMIGLPFLLWLPLSLFDFWNIDQLLSLLAIVALFIIITPKESRPAKRIRIDLLCFLLLTLPIIGRLIAVPLEVFNYLAFIIPVALFVILYLASLFLDPKDF